MTSYSNIKIRNKLILGFSTVVLIALSIGIVGYFQIHKLDNANEYLFSKGVKPVEYIGDIMGNFQRLRSNLRESILVSEDAQNFHYEQRVLALREEIEASCKDLEKTLPDYEAKRLYKLFMLTRNNFTPHVKRIVELAKYNKDEEAFAYLKSETVVNAERAEMEAIENLQFYLVVNTEMITAQNTEAALTTGKIMLWLSFGASLLAALMALLITRSIANPLNQVLKAVLSQQESVREKARLVEAIASGDLNQEVHVAEPLSLGTEYVGEDETGVLLKAIVAMSTVQHSLDQAFADMTITLRNNRDQEALQDWFTRGQNELGTILRGDKPLGELTEQILSFLIGYLDAGVGIFYVFDEKENHLHRAASYALAPLKRQSDHIALGEGIAGQAALERKMKILHDVPPDYLSISSALGAAEPAYIVALPLVYNGVLTGLVEIGSFTSFSDDDVNFLTQIMETLAIAVSVNRSRQQVNELLEQTQSQTEELRVQQEELQQTNEELEERAQMLEQQREQIRSKNRDVEEASRELQRKADELQRVSTYKSEFLANMSHELRTPLNSLMILSSLLKDNREGNLTDKQVEFAATINGAGRDLLTLINDILDLSKIESGHLEFHYEALQLAEICQQIVSVFNPIAADKGISFSVTPEESVPVSFSGDTQRIQQILKNLISNACKFTPQGSVSLRVYTPEGTESPIHEPTVAFAVSDTGIGIPADKQSLIFNAFLQADGSTSRTYGGTGLGLSISRQLARTMGGEIALTSEPGKGSTFTLYLPISKDASTPISPIIPISPIQPNPPPPPKTKNHEPLPMPIADDREQLPEGGKSILIIEDDLTFAAILVKMVRDRGFSALVAADGESGIGMSERYRPSAVMLDVMLPHIDGWGVMRSLKDNPLTRHIPVHFITCLEERQKAMSMGAVGFVTKPVSSEQMDDVFSALESAIEKTMKMLLIVEDDPLQAKAMVALLEERNVTIAVAETGAKAIQLLSRDPFDCIVLDLGLADMGAFELLEELKILDPGRRIPVIIHTGRELTREDETRLHHYAESIIIKGAKSPERLLNEVTLFLHLVETSLDPGKQRMIRSALDKEAMLEGKKILIVDDDMRNIFSLSSALAEKNIIFFEAENGYEALKRLDEHPDIDLVLMDIMMPEMDGYEAMRRIRVDARFNSLPIIALTAKAMKGDREECLKAGASDYIPKPVNMDKLFSLLRVWLYEASSDRSI
jgi:signal transduction histidine kinase/DNA-binding response OmpR family regulator/CHASE3 domain sensor protein